MPVKNIVIIDDEKDFTFFIKSLLESVRPYKVTTAADGKDGLRLVRRIKPDMVLLDITMPGLSGFDVLDKIKSDRKTQSIPVVMLSAHGDDDSRIKAAGLYNEEYITKPVTREDLLRRIDAVLQRAPRQ